MKKKKLDLDIDYSDDYKLIGIISAAKSYKLAWEINHWAAIKLVREKDLQINTFVNNEEIENQFTCFSYFGVTTVIKLFRNKAAEISLTKNNVLVPEFPHYDYILFIQPSNLDEINRLQEVLRNIPSVEWLAFIPLGVLESKEYFIF